MILQELLSLIQDEEARIELEIDIEGESDYQYKSFWLSDYRVGTSGQTYKDWAVENISFMPGNNADIMITIKK